MIESVRTDAAYSLPLAKVLVYAPEVEPVTVVEAMEHVRGTEDDKFWLASRITAAREQIELATSRVMITQTWDAIWDTPPASPFVLLPAPLQSVVGIYTTDDDGVESTVDASNYIVDTISQPARISLSPGGEWPECRAFASFRIRYVCGYGDVADTTAQALRDAILMSVAHWYRYREGGTRLPVEVTEKIAKYRVRVHRGA